VELRQGNNLIGDITASRLSIEENAVFAGRVDLLQGVNQAAEKVPAAAHASGGAQAAGLLSPVNE